MSVEDFNRLAEEFGQASDPGADTADDNGGKEDTVEDIARAIGWTPKEEWNRDPSEWVDAKKYLLRSRDIQDGMKKTLDSVKDELRATKENTKKVVDEFKDHFRKLHEIEVKELKQEVERLEGERKAAIEDGDYELVTEIEEKIGKSKASMEEKSVEDEADSYSEPEPDPEYEERNNFYQKWKENNSWYTTDDEMTKYAEAQSKLPEFNGMKYETMLKRVEQRVKEQFPDKFTGKRSPSVEGSTPGGATKRLDTRDLTGEEAKVMDRFVGLGIMTREEYLRDLSRIRGQ